MVCHRVVWRSPLSCLKETLLQAPRRARARGAPNPENLWLLGREDQFPTIATGDCSDDRDFVQRAGSLLGHAKKDNRNPTLWRRRGWRLRGLGTLIPSWPGSYPAPVIILGSTPSFSTL